MFAPKYTEIFEIKKNDFNRKSDFYAGASIKGKKEFFRCEGVFLLVVTEKWKKMIQQKKEFAEISQKNLGG